MSDDDKLSFLDQQDEPAPENDDPAPQSAAQEADPVKGESEQSVEATEPEAQNAPKEVEPQSTEPNKPGFVPLGALLDEREKRKVFERRIQEIEEREKQAQTKAPDPIDDPEGHARHQQAAIDQARNEIKLETSEEMMRDRLGDGEFDKVASWWREQVQQNPHLVTQGLQQRNPWKFAHDQYKRSNVLSEVGTDLEAYRNKIIEAERAKWEAEQSAQLSQSAAPVQSQPTRQPPPSLANTPQAASAKDVPVGPGQAFDESIR